MTSVRSSEMIEIGIEMTLAEELWCIKKTHVSACLTNGPRRR